MRNKKSTHGTRGSSRRTDGGCEMSIFLGLAMVFGLVFGGFMLSGGKMDIVLYALPYEGMMIGGAGEKGLNDPLVAV